MSIELWLKNSWIEPHRTTAVEVRNWLKTADRCLTDANVKGLSKDSAFNLGYQSMLLFAIVAMATHGYRFRQNISHHYMAIESLEFTLGMNKDDIALIQRFRNKRNKGFYEASAVITESDFSSMMRWTVVIHELLLKHLKTDHSDLL